MQTPAREDREQAPTHGATDVAEPEVTHRHAFRIDGDDLYAEDDDVMLDDDDDHTGVDEDIDDD